MVDVGSHHFVKSERSHRVLVPQPSSDPQDPLVRTINMLLGHSILLSWLARRRADMSNEIRIGVLCGKDKRLLVQHSSLLRKV